MEFSFKDFENWYNEKVTKPKHYRDVTGNDTAPDGSVSASYLQRFSNRVGIARDTSLLNRIEKMLNRYDKVLVVYGFSHFLTLEPSLTATFGKPQFFKRP